MTIARTIEQFWRAYIATFPEQSMHRHYQLPIAWSFGNSQMADELGELVLKGIKSATCSLYFGENVLNSSGLSIIVDSKRKPLCLIETYEVTIRRYKDVDANFAIAEGEGDLSLGYWRQVHWDFFLSEAIRKGYEISEDMLLSCERFRVIYKNIENHSRFN